MEYDNQVTVDIALEPGEQTEIIVNCRNTGLLPSGLEQKAGGYLQHKCHVGVVYTSGRHI
jgi:hypothetical protein